MQIFVSGTWSAHKAEPFCDAATKLGRFIATIGADLTCGPGTGIARHVIDGYRSALMRGKVRYYLPKLSEMEKVGETIEEGADDIIETQFDYPIRNIYQVSQSTGIVIITGGDGALEEAIAALVDYGLPLFALRGSGKAVKALEILINIFPEWESNMNIVDNIEDLISVMSAKLDKITREE